VSASLRDKFTTAKYKGPAEADLGFIEEE